MWGRITKKFVVGDRETKASELQAILRCSRTRNQIVLFLYYLLGVTVDVIVESQAN
jgi:hypothetical protein